MLWENALGGGEVGVNDRVRHDGRRLAHLRAARRRLAAACSWSSPPTRCSRWRWAASTCCCSRFRHGTRRLEPGLPVQGVLRRRSRAASTGRRSATRSSTSPSRLGLCFAIGYPGRLLRRPPRQAHQDAADRAAGDPVLGQLPAADAGLDRPACRPTATSTRCSAGPRDRAPAQLARRQRLLGDPGARLRLHPVLHPAGVRGPRPDRPQPDRGRPRPRRDAVSRRSCSVTLPLSRPASSPARRWSCCRCSATTTPTT